MINSSDIRKKNKKTIYKTMLDGRHYTKQQISTLTGLSIATCNTLLNDMKSNKELDVDKEKELRGVGRGSTLFAISSEHEYYILINIHVSKGKRIADFYLVNAIGTIVEEKQNTYDSFDLDDMIFAVNIMNAKYGNVKQIVISVPGVIDEDEVKFCDIEELEGVKIASHFTGATVCMISVINDMHGIVYGYQAERKDEKSVVTLAGFTSHLLPGTVTMHKGQVISGSNGIAGLVGFMPFDVDVAEIPGMMAEGKCFDIIAKIIGSIIAFLNPNEIVLTGDLINRNIVADLITYCKRSVPEEYMPEFIIVSGFDEYLFRGMFQIAVDNKIL